MDQERINTKRGWDNCANGLVLAKKNEANSYLCSNKSIIDSNGRPSGNFGNIAFVELSEEDKTSFCASCQFHQERNDFRTHKDDESDIFSNPS